jgi:bifunctional UDP-N-acetylglucosamine pyrophosphorylase / glucosamine-1-phosphate N-acetyltransferase
MSDLTAVVLAAGKGTRMVSSVPKVLHELCGRPLVGWPIAAVREAGAARVVVVASPGVDLSAALPADAVIAHQPEANGTGGAVQAAAAELPRTGTVLVVNGDVPLVTGAALQDLLAAHAASGAAGTVASATLDEPGAYCRVVRGADGLVTKIVEAKAGGDATPEELAIREVNAGIYAFEAGPLHEALGRLTSDNAQGELYLTDVVAHLRDAGHRVGALDVGADSMLGVNDRVELAQVRAIAQRRILEALMRGGVTVLDPAATYVDVGVAVGQDTVLHPGTVLRGATVVGAGCSVGPHVVAQDVTVDDGASVGPFAYLRPGTHLRAGAKVGTFVELKNTDLGEGAKVPHLSYVGDATVGAGSNLGAATITANYDPKRKVKSRTTLGERVKTGVDTTLVAPVELGDDAYTAAGSVITKDVPSGALGVARARQTSIEGYADRG